MGIFSGWLREIIFGNERKKTIKSTGTKKRKSPIKEKKKQVDSLRVKQFAKKKKTKVKKKLSNKTIKDKSFLQKFEGNPIVFPSETNRWESKATFNPAALHAEGKIHLLYRAMGDSDISVLGYAASEDGFVMSEKLEYPAYYSLNTRSKCKKGIPPISYVSGGGLNGGCEDPRMTLIEDTVYLTYTAFDGWGSARLAMTYIPIKDFLNKEWNWEKPMLISAPGEIAKNWVLFPEKINGKFAVLHTLSPQFLIDYLDDLKTLDGKDYIESVPGDRVAPKNHKGLWVRGPGAPPIKTEKGWLLIYHVMDTCDPDKYKLGAMLLDLKNPQKIIAKSIEPILEPDMHYENEGTKAGVVYCCGAVIKDNKLFIYYGGSDDVSCVATADIDKFIKNLIRTGKPKVKRRKRKKRVTRKKK